MIDIVEFRPDRLPKRIPLLFDGSPTPSIGIATVLIFGFRSDCVVLLPDYMDAHRLNHVQVGRHMREVGAAGSIGRPWPLE